VGLSFGRFIIISGTWCRVPVPVEPAYPPITPRCTPGAAEAVLADRSRARGPDPGCRGLHEPARPRGGPARNRVDARALPPARAGAAVLMPPCIEDGSAVHRLRPLRRAAAIVLCGVNSKSLAKGGLSQHHRHDSDGMSPEIDIAGWRSSDGAPGRRRSASAFARKSGRDMRRRQPKLARSAGASPAQVRRSVALGINLNVVVYQVVSRNGQNRSSSFRPVCMEINAVRYRCAPLHS
jgi:hypothetical protein